MVPRERQLAGLDQPFLHVRVAAMPVPVALFTLWSWGLAMALDAVQMQRSIDSLWLLDWPQQVRLTPVVACRALMRS